MPLHPAEITRARIRGINYPVEAEQIFRQALQQKPKEELIDYIISYLGTERILDYLERENLLNELVMREEREDKSRMMYRDLHRDQDYY